MSEQRLRRLRQFLQHKFIDGAVLMRPENLRYFSGFTGGEGALVVTGKTAELWTDSRYTEQAAAESGAWYDVKNHNGKLLDCIGASVTTQKVKILGYEKDAMLHSVFKGIKTGTHCGFEGMDFTPLRAVKEPNELASTRRASDIADKAFAKILPLIKPGVTEQYLSAHLESEMLLSGSEEKSFYTIVASGARSAMPHGAASPKVIEKGDFVTFDFGAVCDGYHSDITRTVVVGKATSQQKDFYNLVLDAQLLGVRAVHDGADKKGVDTIVRNYFARYHMDQYFTHALGHGTGLQIHEEPVLAPRSKGILQTNMIVTVEPGLYIEGKYGVRIEDSVVVTAEGCEILTKTAKELMELS